MGKKEVKKVEVAPTKTAKTGKTPHGLLTEPARTHTAVRRSVAPARVAGKDGLLLATVLDILVRASLRDALAHAEKRGVKRITTGILMKAARTNGLCALDFQADGRELMLPNVREPKKKAEAGAEVAPDSGSESESETETSGKAKGKGKVETKAKVKAKAPKAPKGAKPKAERPAAAAKKTTKA